MPDISKLNAVAIGDVAKVDAVLKANIANILGLTLPSGAAFLLDTYTGAAAGYSVRRIATSATVLVRVRRETAGGTGDDDEADVAYDSNNILSLDSAISNASVGVTATTLGQFINVGTVGGTTYTNPDSLTVTASCLLNTWYDQASSNDATQTTQGSQPQIHDGTVNTDLITENGKPAVKYDGTSDAFPDITLSSAVNINNIGSFAVGRWAQASPGFPSITNLHTGETDGFAVGYRGDQYVYNDSVLGSHGVNDLTQRLWSGYADNASSDVKFYRDGAQQASTTTVSDTHSSFHLGGLGHTPNSTRWNGYVQEAILFGVSTKANHSNIETDVNTEYLIYQPTDAPTSGLLATYTGAAAAYSVRQLSDKAVIALRIRRDSDDEETNIGWDANGDLDTTAISDFCTTANGYVTRWWDQSTNGNHADQATDTSQPQIYNGTAVITENGKPAVDFDGTDDRLVFINTGLDIGSLSSCTVGKFNSTSQTAGMMMVSGSSSNKRWYAPFEFVAKYRFGYVTTTAIDGGTSDTSQHLFTMMAGSTLGNASAWVDGAFKNSATLDSGISSSGYIGDADSTFADCLAQEVVVWGADQSSNRTGIETDINTYFSIY